jgi:hypothetical protein
MPRSCRWLRNPSGLSHIPKSEVRRSRFGSANSEPRGTVARASACCVDISCRHLLSHEENQNLAVLNRLTNSLAVTPHWRLRSVARASACCVDTHVDISCLAKKMCREESRHCTQECVRYAALKLTSGFRFEPARPSLRHALPPKYLRGRHCLRGRRTRRSEWETASGATSGSRVSSMSLDRRW